MKIVPNVFQHEAGWFQARAGIPTASEFHQFMDTSFDFRKGEMAKTFVATKCAEAMIKGPLPGMTTLNMEFGNILEEEAVPWAALEFDVTIKQGLFITTDDGRAGCSPDGLVNNEWGLEIKCPGHAKHVSYLLAGKVPNDYLAQVHGSLFVTGLKRWVFVSYHRRYPKLVVTVERDEQIMEKIGASLETFYTQFNEAMKKLKAIK